MMRKQAIEAKANATHTATFGKTNTSNKSRPKSAAPSAFNKNSGAAVPTVNKFQAQYDEYADLFELDVVFTIDKDLREAADEQKQRELNYLQKQTQHMKKQERERDSAEIKRMLQLYLFYPKQVLGDPEEERKIALEERKKRREELKAQKENASKNNNTKPKDSENANKQQVAPQSQKKVIDLSKFDASQHPAALVDEYNFWLKLFGYMLDSKQTIIADPVVAK